MSLYFLLGTLSYAGQKMVRDNPDLIVAATRNIQVVGAEFLGQYGVLGRYDYLMMVEENKSRTDFKERFEQLIADYNAGSLNVDILFDELVNFTQDLNEEAERHIRENLSEEELAIFDILTRPDMQLTQKETDDIKQVCRDLLNTLRAEKLVLDWKKRQNTVAAVEVTIGKVLDSGLPPQFEKEVYDTKCQLIFDHVYDCYMGEGKSIYETAATAP